MNGQNITGHRPHTWLKPSRIEALSDGIFAIAMTILVLSFETILKHPAEINERYLTETIIGLWPDFLHYVESFVILGAFWYQHHRQFHYIKSVDPTLIFINIIGLMFVALIPFTTVMVSDFGHSRPAALVFEANLFVAGFVFFIHWLYASGRHHLISPDIDGETIKFYRYRNLTIPAVSLCAVLMSLLNPRIGTMLYFLVPLVLFFWRGKRP